MEAIEYRTVDKSEWGPGEWQDEPDKVQWKDEATGLPCLIVRNWSGALCGYAGVSEGHPLFAKDYSATLPHECDGSCSAEYDYHRYDASPAGMVSVHGGLTFSGFCFDASRERWEKWRANKPRWEAEAIKYPKGDAARSLREGAGQFDDYEAWKLHAQQTSICHLPAPGEPDHVWWFGFDCAHSGDSCPGSDGLLKYGFGGEAHYKDMDYVKGHVASLARQLAGIRPAPAVDG